MAEAIKGLNIKLGLDTTELESSIKSLNSDLKEQQRDLAAINKNLKYDSSNVDLWKQKQDKLNGILETTKKKLEEQKKQLELAKEGVKLGTVSEQEFKKMQRAVQYTEAEVAKLNEELKQTDNKISALGKIDVNKLSAIGGAMTKYITAPVTAAVTALSALALKTTETVNQMADTAKQLGVGLEALQKWEYAAKQLGSETQYLDKAFQKVNSLLGQIANGDDVSEQLAKIGLTMARRDDEKLEKEIKKVSKTFYDDIASGKTHSPSFKRLIMFNVWRAMNSQSTALKADYEYWESTGLKYCDFSPDVKLPLIKKAFAKLLHLILSRVFKK